MKNPKTFAVLVLASAVSVACGGPSDSTAKGGSETKATASAAATKKNVSSSESQIAVRGARDSSGDGDVVVNVRSRDAAPGDLALVASCGDKIYAQTQDASARPECDVASGRHEAR